MDTKSMHLLVSRGARGSEHSRISEAHARGDSGPGYLCPILSVLWSGIVKVVKKLFFQVS